MEIDHFDPRKKSDVQQQYENLFLATRHCNGAKGQYWPTAAEQRDGMRFLNPCKEEDYGTHIFEDPVTGRLVGTTPAGRFHILHLDLNAPHLIRERKRRAEIFALFKSPMFLKPNVLHDVFLEAVNALRNEFNEMIPLIPPPPTSSTHL